MPSELDLIHRDALPDALRVLIAEFPRGQWTTHPNYSGLIAFWLDRHLMFRRLMAQLTTDAEQALDGAMDPEGYKQRLARFGGMLINELHGHHQIEDAHYFPVMAQLDPTLPQGFDLLDKDHHALDEILHSLTDGANAVLRPSRLEFLDAVAAFHKQVAAFDPLLNRHLVDEEELIVPVLLKYTPEGLV